MTTGERKPRVILILTLPGPLSLMSASRIALLKAEQEQRRQYDTSALRAALAEYPTRNLPSLSAESEQRRQYDTSALRAALADHPSRPLPVLRAENEQRRQYDTTAVQAALAESQPETSAIVRSSVRPSTRASRTSRRPTSYFNAFQTSCSTSTDAPPGYTSPRRWRNIQLTDADSLPEYSCSVFAEAKLFCCVESLNPLCDATAAAGDWREVYVTIRGTMLSVYRLKDGAAGRLVYTYTLQHAEVGLAPDVEHTVLVPQTRFAHFIPSSARRRAWLKDETLFRPTQQTILRIRVETEQLLFSGSDEEGIHAFMFAIGSAIDIAQPIDDRSIPRQCTVPRRRRNRPRPQSNPDLTSPALLAEQERIFETMYPGLAAERQAESPQELPEVNTDRLALPMLEEDEIDTSLLGEEDVPPRSTEIEEEDDDTFRPSMTRQTTAATMNATFCNEIIYETSPGNFDLNGKWSPPHVRSPAQIQRYLRRCLPLLLAESPRASDIMICQGKRVKVNWRMELLEDWEMQPPSYKSHDFPTSTTLARTQSHSSSTSPQNTGSLFSNEQHDDEITPIESGLENLQLTKVMSATPDKRATHSSSPTATNNGRLKGQDPRELLHDIPTAVFF